MKSAEAITLMALLAPSALSLPASAADPGELIRGRRGCILLADLRTGGRYIESTADMHRRAFPPGSVFKVASAMALLRRGNPGPLLCRGRYTDRGRRRLCVLHAGHGPVGLEEALARSCNFYFREKGADREALLAEAMELGLARAESLPALRREPLEDLVLGLAPSLALTPEEMLEAVSLWARRKGPPWSFVRRALVECVRSGTCRGARVEGISVAGKTGSPEAPDGSSRTQAWFAGFAPSENPSVAVVVFLEKGRGSEAAAVAGEVLKWYFRRSPS